MGNLVKEFRNLNLNWWIFLLDRIGFLYVFAAKAANLLLYIRYGKLALHKQRIFSRNLNSSKNLLSIS